MRAARGQKRAVSDNPARQMRRSFSAAKADGDDDGAAKASAASEDSVVKREPPSAPAAPAAGKDDMDKKCKVGGSGASSNSSGISSSSSSGSSSDGSSSSSSSCSDNSSSDDDDPEETHIAPITDARTVTFDIADLNPHLTCRLCNGYFRDAHTIVECLHTFCKSCLFKLFSSATKSKAKCPHCKVSLAANPRTSVIADRTLQQMVDKIFPKMAADDEAAEHAFYAERNIPLREEFRANDMGEEASGGGGGGGGGRSGDRGGGSGGSGSSGKGRGGANAKRPRLSRKARDKDNGEAISFKLAPEAGPDTPVEMALLPLDKPFLRTSGNLKVVHLKKYLMKKLALKNVAEIEILCKGETLGQELSLLFISKSRWLDADRDLVLNYRSCEENS